MLFTYKRNKDTSITLYSKFQSRPYTFETSEAFFIVSVSILFSFSINI